MKNFFNLVEEVEKHESANIIPAKPRKEPTKKEVVKEPLEDDQEELEAPADEVEELEEPAEEIESEEE